MQAHMVSLRGSVAGGQENGREMGSNGDGVGG